MNFCFFSKEFGWLYGEPVRVFTSSTLNDEKNLTEKYYDKTGTEIYNDLKDKENLTQVQKDLLRLAKIHDKWWYYTADTIITSTASL